MCGIVGIRTWASKGDFILEYLPKMRDAMVHRGPDGDGLWLSDDGAVGLAHRRLSIVDLSSLADQPMPNEKRDVWLTYNGEIYNHAALRPELVRGGHRFVTDHSDTEVLVHGFEEWGIGGLLERLSGDFAFAIFDTKDQALYLARDPVGVKPVYFAEIDGEFVFASEIKAILEHPRAERDVDPIAMVHYLSFLTTPAPLTMFKGIYKLPAGCWLKVGADKKIELTRYYSPGPGNCDIEREVKGLSPAATERFFIDGIKQRLDESIERRMMSDVPFGVFLSGGIDSSTNLALMSKYTNQPVNTFTVGFKGHPELNELDFARQAAQQFGANYREVLIDENDMIGYIDQLVHHQDEPLADYVCIPLYFVSKLAHDSGVTVVQVGEGADEQFAGYDGYLRYLKLHDRFWEPWQKHVPKGIQSFAAKGARGLSSLHPKARLVADTLDRAARDREYFWILSMSLWNSRKDQLVKYDKLQPGEHHQRMIEAGILDPSILVPDSFAVIKSLYDEFDTAHPTADALTRMTYNEFRLRLAELLLMRVDKITMSVSLEARVPFLDKDMVDFTFSIPGDLKVKNGDRKYLMKKAVEGLIPDDLIYRKKMGFGAPMAQWMRGDFGRKVEGEILSSKIGERDFLDLDYLQEMFREHRGGRIDLSLQLWTIYNLVCWYEYWIGGKSARS